MLVVTCGPCSRSSQHNVRAEMTIYHAGAPTEKLHLDFLGPLPRTKKWNEYCLVMMDKFIK